MSSLAQVQSWCLPLEGALDKLLLLRLADLVDERGEHPRPISLEHLAKDCSCHAATIRRALRRLASAGWISVAETPRNGIGPMGYRLAVDRIRAVALAQWQAEASTLEPSVDISTGVANCVGGSNLQGAKTGERGVANCVGGSNLQGAKTPESLDIASERHRQADKQASQMDVRERGTRSWVDLIQDQDLDLRGALDLRDQIASQVDHSSSSRSASSSDDRFRRFWSAYPRRVGRAACWVWWQRAKPDDAMVDQMIATLAWQCRTAEWTKSNGDFVPHPRTWLNQGRWLDEPRQVGPQLNERNARNLSLVRDASQWSHPLRLSAKGSDRDE